MQIRYLVAAACLIGGGCAGSGGASDDPPTNSEAEATQEQQFVDSLEAQRDEICPRYTAAIDDGDKPETLEVKFMEANFDLFEEGVTDYPDLRQDLRDFFATC